MTAPATLTSALIVVRHGESDWNLSRRTQGQDDRARLTERGRAQARSLADALRPYERDLIVSSDLTRASQTAAIIAKELSLPVEIEPLLRERDYGELQAGPLDAVTVEASGVRDGVLVSPDARPVGGESFSDVVRRADRFLLRASAEWPDRRLVIVTHGGMIRALRASWFDTPLEGMKWDRVVNASLWTLPLASDASEGTDPPKP